MAKTKFPVLEHVNTIIFHSAVIRRVSQLACGRNLLKHVFIFAEMFFIWFL